MGRRATITALIALLAAVLVPVAAAAPTTTLQRTIGDYRGADDLLEYGPGEDYTVVGADQDFRPPRSGSLLNFLQLTDFQLVDEESPGRVEFLDTTQRSPFNPFSAAYRPEEAEIPQVTEAMVRQARNTISPITGKPLDLTILTGDNADSQQYNETRWFIDILDGTTGSEDPDPEMHADVTRDRKIVPDSGIESDIETTCSPAEQAAYRDNRSVYDGVRGGGSVGPDPGYYEPDGSSGAKDDGDGYSPDRNRNRIETGNPEVDVVVRDFPGLLEDAQQPFEALGLGMPWYSAFGNHDALVQGNSDAAYAGPFDGGAEKVNPVYDGIVRGCLKPNKLPTGGSPEGFLQNPSATLDNAVVVPPDPRRCHLAKDSDNDAADPCDKGGWIQQHGRTTGTPVGHGFEPFTTAGPDGPQTGTGRPPIAQDNHDGYYSFVPRPGLRFVVLDTITDECGGQICSEGSIDNTQYGWLEGQIDEAKTAHQYVVVFSHHTERTIRSPSTDTSEDPIHYGERFDNESTPPQPVSSNEEPTLEDLLCAHENVLAHVDGHEHANLVIHHTCEDSPSRQNPFWEVSTAAHIDWPQQSRMIELVDNGNGTMSLVLTMLDHDGPAYPGGPPPDPTANGEAGEQVLRLASIGREISCNDYQHSRGARGSRDDRNVIIVVPKPPPGPDTP